ncbi:hypothetical protein EC973_003815 [Apophysomyces ossiformis]|uniref:GAR domain-containing protein n=1 Tax=Apophysomyces ossiformis TaxID=679940 RepID=A0A8H7BQE5_9FUNG|nr:hypothetical protein EC973_003815 [Apophysomyces ossiformis]
MIRHLESYVELSLLPPLHDFTTTYWSDGSAFLCLGHRFFPDSVPNLVGMLHDKDPQHNLSTALKLFSDRLQVVEPKGPLDESTVISYLCELRKTIEQAEMEDMQQLSVGESTVLDETFEQHATLVLSKICQLRTQLNDLSFRHQYSHEGNTSTTTTTHSSSRAPSPFPRDTAASDDGEASTTDADEQLSPQYTRSAHHPDDLTHYQSTLKDFEASLTTLESNELASFRAYVQTMPEGTRTNPEISARIQAIDAAHNALDLQLQKGATDLDTLRSGMIFSQITTPIRNELEFIQAKMLKTTTTETGIQDLEERSRNAGLMISKVQVQYADLLNNANDEHSSYHAHFDVLVQKYKLISAWVDDVRVWFIEAERIRQWIEERIRLLESKPVIDALDLIEIDYTMAEVDAINSEHENLEKEVEKFDKEDMTRLRAHVKALTGKERGNKDLSPADTTTIEITFTTLMTLDRLIHLLRRRTHDLQILTLRMFWEKEYQKTIAWVRATNDEVEVFIHEKARWRLEEYRELSLDENDHKLQFESVKNTIIEVLLGFEQRVAAFDQGQFTATVNTYQDLDDSSNVELPTHLESRQVAVEEAFEELSNRVAFARQVVEQRLSVTDFLYRADMLKTEGEQLRQEITAAELTATSCDTDKEFTEKVQLFQEQAIRLVTGVAPRISYPETTHPSDQEDNYDANESIRTIVGARKSSLVLFGEALDHKLSSYRRVLQLHKRNKQLLEEIARIQSWIEERARNVKKAKVDVFVGKCALDETDLGRLKKERDGQLAKMNTLKENDIKKLERNIHGLESSIKASEAPVDSEPLNEGLQKIYENLGTLDDVLQQHSLELNVLSTRISWESQHAKASQWVAVMTHKVWDFLSQNAQWRPEDSEQSVQDTEKWENIEDEFQTMQRKIDDFQEKLLKSTDKSFDELAQGFSTIIMKDGPMETLEEQERITPEHVQRRHNMLHDNFAHLMDTSTFTKAVMDQRVALTEYVSKVHTTQDSGMQILCQLEDALETIMAEKVVPSFEDAVRQFDQEVCKIWSHCGSLIPYPTCPAGARASRPSTEDDDINNEINTVVLKLYDELLQLSKKLHELLSMFNSATGLKREIIQCAGRMRSLNEQIVKLISQIMSEKLDLNSSSTTYTDQQIHALMESNQGYTGDVARQLVELTGMKQTTQDLETRINSSTCKALDVSVVTSVLFDLQINSEKLVETSAKHSIELTAYAARIQWETKRQTAHAKVIHLQELSRDLMDRKSMWLSSTTDNSEDTMLDELKEQCSTIASEITRVSQTDLRAMESTFNQVQCLYAECSVAVPTEIVNQQRDIQKLVVKLQDTNAQRQAEIDFLISRVEWDHDMDKCLDRCKQNEHDLENLICEARWTPDTYETREPERDPFINAVNEAADEFEKLLTRLDDLKSHKHASLLSDGIQRRVTSVTDVLQRTQNHVQFAGLVAEQRRTVNELFADALDLEKLAEATKTSFLAAEGASQDNDQALERYNARLAIFSESIENRIPYPIREYDNHGRALDIKANVVVQETMDTRHARLNELSMTLQSILKAKLRLSRRKAAVESYLSEAQVVKDWIEPRMKNIMQALDATSPGDLPNSVAVVDAISSAIQAYGSSYNALKESAKSYTASMQGEVKETEDENEVCEITENIQKIESTQAEVDQLWSKITTVIVDAKDRLSVALRLAEYTKLVDGVDSNHEKLQKLLVQTEVSEITDEVISGWQEEIEKIKVDGIEQIHGRLLAEQQSGTQNKAVGSEDLQSMQTAYSRVVKEHSELIGKLQVVAKKASSYRLKKDYAAAAGRIEEYIRKTTLELLSMREHGIVSGDKTQDNANCKELSALYEKHKVSFEEYTEHFDEQRSFYRFIQLQKVEDLEAVDTRQKVLEGSWKALKADLATAGTFVDTVVQWSELHSMLNEVDGKLLVNLKGSIAELGEELFDKTKIAAQFQVVHARLDATRTIASKIAVIDEDDNRSRFHSHYDEVLARVNAAEAELKRKEKAALKRVAYNECQKLLEDLRLAADKETKAIKSRITLVVETDMFEQGAGAVEKYYRKVTTQTAASEETYQTLTKECSETLQPQIEELSRTHGCEEKIDISGLEVSLNALCDGLNMEKALNDIVRRVLANVKSSDDILSWISNCKNAINAISNDTVMMDDKEAEMEAQDVEKKICEFEPIVREFEEISANLLGSIVAVEGNTENPAIDHLRRAVKNRAEKVQAEWQETLGHVADLKKTITRTQQGVSIVRKMKTIMIHLGETRDHVASLQIFEDQEKPLLLSVRESEILTMNEDLRKIEEEVTDQIVREINELDELIAQFQDTEMTFTRQRTEVDAAFSNWKEIIESKRREIDRALPITKYLTITDDSEILLGALEEAVEKAAPHRATMIGSSFSRADLQAKLIELDARYKYYECKIVQSLEAAEESLSDITEEEASKQAKEHFHGLKDYWEAVDNQVKTRKADLQNATETAVDQEERRQFRNRKSSLPTRKAASVLRESPRVIPTTSSSSIRTAPTVSSRLAPSSSSPRPHGNRSLNQRYLNPPILERHQPSKSATSVKPTIRVSRPAPNAYVADPDNDLDMEIGRIVNETPYKVKVKMVPGEVGRYWFGEVNPKLCYCRVLKSKMVMVRVGGGWTELSQFLRDHALLEGDFIPKAREEEAEQTALPSIQEGFIETRRAKSPSGRPILRGRSTSPTPPPILNRSQSSGTGYKDGDKFIAVDRHGNQLEVKMTRAGSNDYTRRRLSRKKDSQNLS